MDVAEPYRGPWPDTRPHVERELSRYLAAASDPAIADLPTRCPPWSVRDLTAHLAATFERFNRMLAQGRSGDLRRPFATDELSQENLRAVRAFAGDPLQRLEDEARAFLAGASDTDEVMPHQFGPLPVGLQLIFGLNEVAIHHDDLAAATGGSYRPDDEVVAVMLATRERVVGGLPSGVDPWRRVLAASGRTVG